MLTEDPGPPQQTAGLSGLSARERELATMVAQGRTNAQIAPPSCASASALCPRTWSGSGTRPAAAAAPT
jgi:hypothetical protein